MQKFGHPLQAIPGFDKNVVTKLRDDFSVTTAEEFVGLCRSVPEIISKLLGEEHTARLAVAARETIGEEEMAKITEAQNSDYPFSTGHEPPPDGKETF